MIPIYKNKRNIRTDGLRQLLSQVSIRTIEDNLFTKSIIQKRKKMKMKTKERKKLLINNKKHIEEKQNTIL